MEFIDTQIISYKFKNNRELFDGDIKGRQISSIVALEFLGIMMKNENKAKMYPIKLINIVREHFIYTDFLCGKINKDSFQNR